MADARGASETYFIRPDYTARPAPEYFRDLEAGPAEDDGVVWQPDVYTHAAAIAKALGATRIVDIGCGSGKKLAALAGDLDIVGIDYGPNIAECRTTYPVGRWIEFDLSDRSALIPLDAADWAGSVVVSSDVIEHLVEPEHLLRQVAHGLGQGAAAAVISTPDRVRTYGTQHLGPPPNPAHVREWEIGEFEAFLRAQGFAHTDLELTRSHTGSWDLMTILARVYPSAATAAKVRASGVALPTPPPAPPVPLAKRVRSLVASVPGARALKRALRG
jgi:SAM-dependent methyltransferase